MKLLATTLLGTFLLASSLTARALPGMTDVNIQNNETQNEECATYVGTRNGGGEVWFSNVTINAGEKKLVRFAYINTTVGDYLDIMCLQKVPNKPEEAWVSICNLPGNSCVPPKSSEHSYGQYNEVKLLTIPTGFHDSPAPVKP